MFKRLFLLLFFSVISSNSSAAGYRLVDHTVDEFTFKYAYRAPDVCKEYYASIGDLLSCLRGKITDPHFVQGLGLTDDRKSVYGNFYETYSVHLMSKGLVDADYHTCYGDGLTECYAIGSSYNLNYPTLRSLPVVFLSDASGNPLNNSSYDEMLFYQHANNDHWLAINVEGGDVFNNDRWMSTYGTTSNNSHQAPFRWLITSYSRLKSPLAVGYFPDAEVGPVEPEVISCVGEKIHIKIARNSFFSGLEEGDVLYDSDTNCAYNFTDLQTSSLIWDAPCFESPYDSYDTGNDVICSLTGAYDVADDETPPNSDYSGSYEIMQPGDYVLMGIYNKSLFIPSVAEVVLGWGNQFNPLTGSASAFGIELDRYISGISDDPARNFKERILLDMCPLDIVSCIIDYTFDPSCDTQFYHPGNYDAEGNAICAYSRDNPNEVVIDHYDEQGNYSQKLDLSKCWNWDGTQAASEVPTSYLECISQSDDPAVADQVITQGRAEQDDIPFELPDVPSACGDCSDFDPIDGDGTVDPSPPDFDPNVPVDYSDDERTNNFLNTLRTSILEEAGFADVLNAFTFNGSAYTTGDYCIDFPVDPKDHSETLPLCVEEYHLEIIKAFLIISAGLYARRMIFGG